MESIIESIAIVESGTQRATAFMIHQSGIFLTVGHAVSENKSPSLAVDGRQISAELLERQFSQENGVDFAVLKIEEVTSLRPVRLARQVAPWERSVCEITGFQSQLPTTPITVSGKIALTRRTSDPDRGPQLIQVQHQGSELSGFSGSPVSVDDNGNRVVVGVQSEKTLDNRNGIAMPIYRVCNVSHRVHAIVTEQELDKKGGLPFPEIVPLRQLSKPSAIRYVAVIKSESIAESDRAPMAALLQKWSSIEKNANSILGALLGHTVRMPALKINHSVGTSKQDHPYDYIEKSAVDSSAYIACYSFERSLSWICGVSRASSHFVFASWGGNDRADNPEIMEFGLSDEESMKTVLTDAIVDLGIAEFVEPVASLFSTSNGARKSLEASKVDFSFRKGCESYGKPVSPEWSSVSLGSCARNSMKSSISVRLLRSLWTEFICAHAFGLTPGSTTIDSLSFNEFYSAIREAHGDVLSRRKLERELAEVLGTYSGVLFIAILKRPASNPKHKRTLRVLFSDSNGEVKLNSFKILPIAEISKYVAYKTYISLFSFRFDVGSKV